MKLSTKLIRRATVIALFFSPILLGCNCSALAEQFGTLTSGQLPDYYIGQFAPNSIDIWNPCENGKRNINGSCGEDVTGGTAEERLREVVEKYGIFFMNAQIEFGVPWEIPIIHSHLESHFGLDKPSVAYDTEKCGYYNWSGYKYGANALYGLSESEMNGCLAWHSDGGFGSQYKNLADMYMSYYTDYLRNGAYDAAFEYATPTNFNPRKFLETETDGIYCSPGCGSGYVSQYDYDIDTIHKIAAEKGWPTSEELMKEYNIPKGGNWSDTWGDIKDHINAEPHSLSVDCSSMTTLGDVSGINLRDGVPSSSSSSKSTSKNSASSKNSSTSSSSNKSSASSDSTNSSTATGSTNELGQKIADKAKELAWPDDNHHNEVKDSFKQAAEANGTPEFAKATRNGALHCAHFVSTVIHAAGVDKDFPKGDDAVTAKIVPYLEESAKWQELKRPDNVDKLEPEEVFQPGDIITYTTGKNGHIFIYVGDNKFAESSQGHWTGRITDTEGLSPYSGGWREDKYHYFRLNSDECSDYEGDYPQYYQGSDYDDGTTVHKWANIEYPEGSGKTIGSSGCGAASMAMLLTVITGEPVYPDDVAKLTMDSPFYSTTFGDLHNLYEKLCDTYGCEYEIVKYDDHPDAIKKMRQYLNDGYMLHLSGQGSAPFSDAGHFIGIYDIDSNDVVTTANSAKNRGVEWNLTELVNAGMHGNMFAAFKYDKCATQKDLCPNENDNTGSHSGGFDSVEEADKVIMQPYRDLAKSGNYDGYYITEAGPYNCFSFSNYFIAKYTTIDFHGVPGVDGGGYAEEFYNIYHDKYPDIKLSKTPTPYSVAGCGDKYYTPGSYSHTFIVLGVNTSKGTMIYGEAALGSGEAGIVANEISLTDSAYASRNGVSGICQYADFSKYIKGL